jgi:hypothetical protein
MECIGAGYTRATVGPKSNSGALLIPKESAIKMLKDTIRRMAAALCLFACLALFQGCETMPVQDPGPFPYNSRYGYACSSF